VSAEELERGAIFPSLAMMRDVSVDVACAVAEVAYTQGLATRPRPANLRAHVRSEMWQPDYPVLVEGDAPLNSQARTTT
jgi:malate dehydrogenase (oxaloacetate-decarboxylating)(NADP+)